MSFEQAGIQKDGLSIVSNGVAISLFAQHADEDEWDRSFERSFQWTTLQEKNMYLSVDFGGKDNSLFIYLDLHHYLELNIIVDVFFIKHAMNKFRLRFSFNRYSQ